MRWQKHFTSTHPPAPLETEARAPDTEAEARTHRVSWMAALDAITSPAFRLHRYRREYNRLLQDAWCKLDCHERRDGGV